MTEPVIEQLVFRPASVKPTADMDGVEVLVYNPCDGWHLGEISVIEDDDGTDPPYIYIRGPHFSELEPHSFYVAWAVLPNGLKFGEHFCKEKGWRSAP